MHRLKSADLKTIVLERARALGAVAVRVAPAGPDVLGRARMEAAFARGDFTTWPYDRAYARTAADPAAVLAGAKSVICIAVAYATAAPARRAPLTGRVSNYAWASDYHAHMRRILSDVAAAIDAAAGAQVTRIACDTAPLAERAFAAAGGLGWIGKHTNVIVPGAGSFVFLGEIISTVELPADAPLKKTCGACTRCVSACPTGALRGDYTIDATRCISDLTQRKDALPFALRPLVGDWLWGCDLCQEVCPPTALAGPRGGGAFVSATAAAAFPALLELLQLRSGEFRRRFAKSSIGWRGAAVLRRNAAVVLGNMLDRAAVPALARALAEDSNAMVRGHAAWALGRIGSPEAIVQLRRHRRKQADPAVVQEIVRALEPFGG